MTTEEFIAKMTPEQKDVALTHAIRACSWSASDFAAIAPTISRERTEQDIGRLRKYLHEIGYEFYKADNSKTDYSREAFACFYCGGTGPCECYSKD